MHKENYPITHFTCILRAIYYDSMMLRAIYYDSMMLRAIYYDSMMLYIYWFYLLWCYLLIEIRLDFFMHSFMQLCKFVWIGPYGYD